LFIGFSPKCEINQKKGEKAVEVTKDVWMTGNGARSVKFYKLLRMLARMLKFPSISEPLLQLIFFLCFF